MDAPDRPIRIVAANAEDDRALLRHHTVLRRPWPIVEAAKRGRVGRVATLESKRAGSALEHRCDERRGEWRVAGLRREVAGCHHTLLRARTGCSAASSKARARALGMGTDLRLSSCGKAVDPSQAMHTPQAIL